MSRLGRCGVLRTRISHFRRGETMSGHHDLAGLAILHAPRPPVVNLDTALVDVDAEAPMMVHKMLKGMDRTESPKGAADAND